MAGCLSQYKKVWNMQFAQSYCLLCFCICKVYTSKNMETHMFVTWKMLPNCHVFLATTRTQLTHPVNAHAIVQVCDPHLPQNIHSFEFCTTSQFHIPNL